MDAFVGFVLEAVTEKLDYMAGIGDSRVQGNEYRLALAESCWWMSAIDEQLEADPHNRYKSRRNSSDDGRHLLGIRFARNHQLHALVRFGRGNVRPFLASSNDDYLLFISSPYRWVPESEVPRGVRDDAKLRKDYASTLAGKEIDDTLRSALRWLNEQCSVRS
jgi:hypothetical protein